ncbi:hypothetical protein MRX96_052059 [Rhipicephalus microplus]
MWVAASVFVIVAVTVVVEGGLQRLMRRPKSSTAVWKGMPLRITRNSSEECSGFSSTTACFPLTPSSGNARASGSGCSLAMTSSSPVRTSDSLEAWGCLLSDDDEALMLHIGVVTGVSKN